MTEEPQAPPEKSTSPWIWVVAGCGGLTILVVLVLVAVVGFGMFKARDFLGDMEENPLRAVAELAIDQDPDLEIVDSDERKAPSRCGTSVPERWLPWTSRTSPTGNSR